MANDTMDAAVLEQGGRRVALLLEYDGGRFAGSQLQSNARTVQGVLEDAILKATEEASRAAFAGRTDAGVHAMGQVAAFTTASRLECATLVRALNAWLPEDVGVQAASEVSITFDPRRDARQRLYGYLIDIDAGRPVLDRGRAWHVPAELNLRAMAAAAKRLVGKRDFAAFASRLEDPTASTVRDLYRFDVSRDGNFLFIYVGANAFLPHQVRRMVGSLVEVGKGRLHPKGFANLLEGSPSSAGPAAPPHGLYLMSITYDKPLFGWHQARSPRPPYGTRNVR